MSSKSKYVIDHETLRQRFVRHYFARMRGLELRKNRLNDKGQVKRLAKLYPAQFA